MHSGQLGERHVRRLVGLALAGQRREELLATALLQPLAARIEIDLPAGELRRETHVLTVAPDRQRELILVDDRLNGLAHAVAEHARDFRRRERELREPLRVRGPGYDVDSITTPLVDDRLDARPLEPDACAEGIDAVLAGEDRDLRAAADCASRRTDLDDVLLDLGELELEQG